MNREDELIFLDDDVVITNIPTILPENMWKICIVDDDEDVHQITHFVLDDYTFRDKPLCLFSAYSAQEARQLCQQHPDMAVMLLDVVMETNDAGLKLVDYIRNNLKNTFVRIILRTGQPGYAPEKEVILKYDINDYKNKTELTDQKLFTVMTASLRAYCDMITIESYRRDLEEKVAERTHELHQKNQKLIQLNQEKSEFLSIAAHDLKNPLSSIQTLAELIQYSFTNFPPEKIIEFATMIGISSRKMFDLIKNLLDVSKIEAGKMLPSLEVLDIRPILQSLLQEYTGQATSKKIKLLYEVSENEHRILVDSHLIRQIFDNILSNAIKYSNRNSCVYIRLVRSITHVYCEIEDEGPGLSENDQQKLFMKFSRLTPRPTGGEYSTGLGLFIAKKLVEMMDGTIKCNSMLNQGTKFIVTFPFAERECHFFPTDEK